MSNQFSVSKAHRLYACAFVCLYVRCLIVCACATKVCLNVFLSALCLLSGGASCVSARPLIKYFKINFFFLLPFSIEYFLTVFYFNYKILNPSTYYYNIIPTFNNRVHAQHHSNIIQYYNTT